MDEQTSPEADWKTRWASGNFEMPGENVAEIMDLDFRISALPSGESKVTLNRGLENVARRLESSSLQTPSSEGTDGTALPLETLRRHVMLVEFMNRNLSLAYSLAWLFSILIWGLVAFLLSFYSSNLQAVLGFESEELSQLWILIFIAGIGGSATAGLWRIYRQDFGSPLTFAYVPQHYLNKKWWTGRLFTRLAFEEAIRAIARPVVGGLFALIVTLILLSGLILEPIASPFVKDTGAIDTENTKGEMFFLAIAVVAGFTEGWVISLLERVRSNVG
ncbi:MAG: hypothetical protein ACE5Q6_03395 [Dehalococcoidia bacterium]